MIAVENPDAILFGHRNERGFTHRLRRKVKPGPALVYTGLDELTGQLAGRPSRALRRLLIPFHEKGIPQSGAIFVAIRSGSPFHRFPFLSAIAGDEPRCPGGWSW
jgi:hypothetical protein